MARRKFLGGVAATACVLPCLGIQGLMAMSKNNEDIPDQDPIKEIKDKFDNLMDKKLTYRENITLQYREFINTMKPLSEEIGEDNLIKFLKKQGQEKGTAWGKWQLKNSPDNSFSSYIKFLDDPFLDNTLSFEIIEKTDKVCEIKVTRCLWAEVFNKEKAGEIGNAYACHGDYHHCKTFNPKIKMVRDKTLTQGHAYCNHRYIFEE